MTGWLCDGNVGSYVVHAQRSSERSNHKKLASSDLLDEEEEIDDGTDGLNYTEKTSGE